MTTPNNKPQTTNPLLLPYSLSHIHEAAEELLQHIGDHKVVVFHAGMGGGKTTLITALCHAMGVTGSIGSPTYAIINQYTSPTHPVIYHMDLYRLNDEEEAIAAGVEDALYSGHPCWVEWPERAPGILPEDALHVYIDTVSPDQRQLRLEGIA